MRIVGIACLLMALPGAQCSFWPGGPACTAVFVYGLSVNLTEQGSGTVVSGATLTLTEGTYTETMEELQTGSYVGAGERAGTYDLTIQATGYQSRTVEDIVITADECHVIPVVRDVTLVPEP